MVGEPTVSSFPGASKPDRDGRRYGRQAVLPAPLPPPGLRSRTDSPVLPRDIEVYTGESTEASLLIFWIFQCASLAHLNIHFSDSF